MTGNECEYQLFQDLVLSTNPAIVLDVRRRTEETLKKNNVLKLFNEHLVQFWKVLYWTGKTSDTDEAVQIAVDRGTSLPPDNELPFRIWRWDDSVHDIFYHQAEKHTGLLDVSSQHFLMSSNGVLLAMKHGASFFQIRSSLIDFCVNNAMLTRMAIACWQLRLDQYGKSELQIQMIGFIETVMGLKTCPGLAQQMLAVATQNNYLSLREGKPDIEGIDWNTPEKCTKRGWEVLRFLAISDIYFFLMGVPYFIPGTIIDPDLN